MRANINFFLLIIILSHPASGLLINCGSEANRPAFDSSTFAGCFVSQDSFTYELIGTSPTNISGTYGVLAIKKGYSCELLLDLNYNQTAIYECGVLFKNERNETIRAAFARLKLSLHDACQNNELPPDFGTLHYSCNKTCDCEYPKTLKATARTQIIISIISCLLTFLSTIILIVITKTHTSRENSTFEMIYNPVIEHQTEAFNNGDTQKSYRENDENVDNEQRDRYVPSPLILTHQPPSPFPAFEQRCLQECDICESLV